MRRAAFLGLVAGLWGCEATAPAPQPALPAIAAPEVVVASPSAPPPFAGGFAIVTTPPPALAPPPRVRVDVEPALRFGERSSTAGDRDLWNKGDVGVLSAPVPAVSGHPLPRVIVDVLRSKGPHKVADLQREARRLFWIHVVGCYATGAYKDQTLKGKTRLRFQVSRAGKVSGVKVESTTLADRDVAACLAKDWKGLALPKARSGSSVVAEVQVFPGDEPIAPPAALITGGDGAVDLPAIRAAVRDRAPDFEGCYRQALAYAPHLWGRIALRFHVLASGQVDEVFEGESHFPDERVTLCVLHAARALHLPAPKGGDARVVVPLRFSTQEAPL